MYKFILFLIIALGMVISADNASAQKERTASIGVVEIETIVKAMPEADSADKMLKDLGQKYRDTLQAMEKEYTTKLDNYDKQKSMMSADQKKKEEDALKQIQMKYAQFQDEKFGVQGEIAQLRDKLLEPIRAKVREAIEAVAKEEKLNFVFDKGSSALLYSEDKADITYRVLDKIKRGGR